MREYCGVFHNSYCTIGVDCWKTTFTWYPYACPKFRLRKIPSHTGSSSSSSARVLAGRVKIGRRTERGKWRTANFAGVVQFWRNEAGREHSQSKRERRKEVDWRGVEEVERKSSCQSSRRCAGEAISQGWKIRVILKVSKFPPSSFVLLPVDRSPCSVTEDVYILGRARARRR